jgi:hypothetical protein
MAMSTDYKNAIAAAGGALITHIGLVDASGVELSGGSPAYARKAVTWTSPSGGTIRPNADLTFDIPAGVTVAGWRGFSALTGGTNYGGQDLTAEAFANQGQYKLLAAGTGILHTDG